MHTPLPRSIGVYLGILQLVFALTWTVYIIYLPRLAAEVGIPKSAVIFILLIDQAIFTITDFAMGMAADKVSRVLGKLGRLVIGITIISCLAFLALPFVAGTGPGAKLLFLSTTAIWVVTSSALRAPPLMLLGKYAPKSSIPMFSGLAMIGLGLAAALSPYLAVNLRDLDPRLPFVLASCVLVVTVLALAKVERLLANHADSVKARTTPETTNAAILTGTKNTTLAIFAFAMLVLAIGFQVHFAFNSAPTYLKFTTASNLQWLMPVFWIGFCVAMLPASLLTKRYGGLRVISGAALMGAAGALATHFAPDLSWLIIAQLVAGAAWGVILMSAISAAQAIGFTGSEGKATGLLFSCLAAATFLRISMVATGFKAIPTNALLLNWLPILFWVLGAITLFWLISINRKQRAAIL